MKPAVTYPLIEMATVDLLVDVLTDEDVTIGVGVPTGWTPAAKTHVQVESDGTPVMEHPVAAHPTVRVVVWAAATTEAQRLAWKCHGLLLAHTGDVIVRVLPLLGVQPTRDLSTRAELAWFTVRATVRSTPL